MPTIRDRRRRAWLPFEEFLASGAATAGASRDAARRTCRRPTGAGAAAHPRRRRADPARQGCAARRARLRDVWVEGEVGQVSISSAGHCYFTLKDERRAAPLHDLPRRPDGHPVRATDGLRVVAHGRIDVFEPQGVYQLYVDSAPAGRLRRPCAAVRGAQGEAGRGGAVRAGRKRPLPAWPRTIGVATSLSGAVLHDMRKVLAPRWPLVRVLVSACQVQGDTAPAEASWRRCGGLPAGRIRATGVPSTCVILARGGGSLEDLWPFNEERRARGRGLPVPIVVGVGHETDVTLAEFAADVRAATPSVAAELSVPSREDQAAGWRDTAAAGLRSGGATVGQRRGRARRRAPRAGGLPAVGAYLAARARARRPPARPGDARHDRPPRGRRAAGLERLDDRLPSPAPGASAGRAPSLERRRRGLAALSPFATLDRGYAIVRDDDGRDRARRRAVARGRGARRPPGRAARWTCAWNACETRRMTARRRCPHRADRRPSVAAMPFDQALAEFQAVVGRLESGGSAARGIHRAVRTGRRARMATVRGVDRCRAAGPAPGGGHRGPGASRSTCDPDDERVESTRATGRRRRASTLWHADRQRSPSLAILPTIQATGRPARPR